MRALAGCPGVLPKTKNYRFFFYQVGACWFSWDKAFGSDLLFHNSEGDSGSQTVSKLQVGIFRIKMAGVKILH